MEAFFGAVSSAWSREDGAALASALEGGDPTTAAAAAAARRAAGGAAGASGGGGWAAAAAARQCVPPSDAVAAAGAQVMVAEAEGDAHGVYEALNTALSLVQGEYRANGGEWLEPALRRLMLRARRAAHAADTALAASGGRADRSSHCGQALMKVFSEGLKRRRRATLAAMNQLFKLYFRLNSHHLCKPLIRARHSPHFLPFESFPVADRVAYLYFVGRLAVASERYKEADESLAEAYDRCARTASSNLRAILEYWVPVRMLLGSVPSARSLKEHSLEHYVDVAAAVRTGDVARLDAALARDQAHFIRAGTYIVLERLRLCAYRTLVKKCHLIARLETPGKEHQIKVATMLTALASLGVETDLDEVECVLANLIFRKAVRGYISHAQRVVVLSKAKPFPGLQEIAWG